MPVITSNNVLSPIAAVDVSSATSGVSMFSLVLDSLVPAAGNLIQFEYWISHASELIAVTNGNGFIALENAVSSQGSSTQYTIAVPSINNDYDPTIPLYVKIRVYVGQTTTSGPEILVSTWSNSVPFYNPPPQTGTPVAFIVPGETSGYVYDDLLYVQVPQNVAYDLTEITFIVSYSYTDSEGVNQWIVSTPLTGTLNETLNRIILPPITLGADVSYGTPIYVAVNAVFNYTYDSNNYFTVSEISTTVEAQMASPGAPTLDPIVIPDDYLVYSIPSLQDVVLTWTAPDVSAIPNYEIDHYVVTVTVDNVVIASITVGPTVLTYTYSIPSSYTIAGTSSTQFSFAVLGVNITGGSDSSNVETVNTFTYATGPQNLQVIWANPGSSTGEVDMMVSFNNPSSNGQGSSPHLMLQVLDIDNNVVHTQQVDYVEGSSPYVIYLNDIVTTDTGTVTVYMVTTDTNATTEGGAFADRNGASAVAAYVSSGLPFITNVNRTLANLTFDVITHTVLGEQCIFVSLSSDEFVSEHFLTATTSGEGPTTYGVSPNTYTVTLITNSITGDLEYSFDFTQDWLTNVAGILSTNPCAITVSNPVGISLRHVNTV